MIDVKEIEIIKTTCPTWSMKQNDHMETIGAIDSIGEFYGKWSNNFRSTSSYIDFLQGNKALVLSDENYPVVSIKYLGIHHMKTITGTTPVKIYVVNNRNIFYNRVDWAHVQESSSKISLSIFCGQVENREICDGLQLITNANREYDVIEEVNKTEQKNEDGTTTYKSIWYSKSTDKRLLCINGNFDKRNLLSLFKK